MNSLMRRCFPLLVLALPVLAQAPEKPLDPASKGKVYTAKSKSGQAFEWYVPEGYDPAVGANLTLILHGSNLDRRWGFANHRAGDFRAADIVVSPDGTTSNGNGGFNFLQGQKDLERLHELHDELRAAFKVRATFLYGHSQGSFFSFYYAGAYPDDVQGLVGQASGVWIGTQATKKHHHQAVVLMHGTADPVVPYEQSVGGLEVYVEAKYPLARLRSLDGWNHWPTQPQTEQQLAWCEGMTTADAGRLEAALTTLARAKDACDPVALRQVAARAASFAGMPEAAKKTAADAMAAVDAVASEHASAITKSAGKVSKDLVDKPWVGHLPLFLRHFRGIPACDEFAAQWASVLDSHAEASKKHGKGYWQDRERKPKEAFVAGVQWLQTAFLTPSTENEEMVAQLESWAADAKKLSLGKAELKAFQTVVPVVRAARDKGRKAFEKVDRRFR